MAPFPDDNDDDNNNNKNNDGNDKDNRPRKTVQISDLPRPTTHITTHDASTGEAIIHSSHPGQWAFYKHHLTGFNIVYTTTSFPVSLNADADISAHDALMKSTWRNLGLVHPGGTVCRMVDYAPGHETMLHRTRSLDYGVVLEGEIELVLDSRERRLIKRGDIVVQRATMHAWRNPSSREWARVLFVLQPARLSEGHVAREALKEDLGRATEELLWRGNDDDDREAKKMGKYKSIAQDV